MEVVREGKHLSVSGRPFRVRGVTYGTFASRSDGALYPEPDRVRDDFAAMREAGLNTVRTYTAPPDDVLDLAAEFELRLLIGVDYPDWRMERQPGRHSRRRVLDAGRRAVAELMERCADTPGVLAIAVGNEIPGDVVRVHGIQAIEAVLSTLIEEVHEADPEMLATYVNFPTTEYLDVEGQDLACFNVFLERPEQLRPYLRHLQVVSGDLPLVITELGLASDVQGEQAQAASLEWQLRLVDETGCAGACVFSWTDDWVVGGTRVEGWEFGLTDDDRDPKPALGVVSSWARSSLQDVRETWPQISAIVCAYNAAETITTCVESLLACDYPGLEIIVCDDGSDDDTADLAERYPVRVLRLQHGGLARARNAGIAAARGAIVAFLDADAACHAEWPYHLALSLEDDGVVGAGGPNLPFAEVGFVERVVAAAPGGPTHVCLSDDRAEHVPGCNMAFEKRAVKQVGCFDPIYTAAGDDVDVCWKLLDKGREIAFSPAAQVLHRRRSSIGAYLRQQRGYGHSERLVSSRHGHRFNGLGQARWAGFIYGGPRILGRLLKPVIYHGSMGTAPFQHVITRRAEGALSFSSALLPFTVPLALLGALAPFSRWWLVAPALTALAALTHLTAVAFAVKAPRGERRQLGFRLLAAVLHTVQPVVRAWGRARSRKVEPLPRGAPAWLGDRVAWLTEAQGELADRRCRVRFGGTYDAWDLEARLGLLVRARVTTAVTWSWTPSYRLALRPRLLTFVALAVAALLLFVSAWWAALALGALALAFSVETALLVPIVRRSLRLTMSGAMLSPHQAGRQNGAQDEFPFQNGFPWTSAELAHREPAQRVYEGSR